MKKPPLPKSVIQINIQVFQSLLYDYKLKLSDSDAEETIIILQRAIKILKELLLSSQRELENVKPEKENSDCKCDINFIKARFNKMLRETIETSLLFERKKTQNVYN